VAECFGSGGFEAVFGIWRLVLWEWRRAAIIHLKKVSHTFAAFGDGGEVKLDDHYIP
jgi:hypothetical protein